MMISQELKVHFESCKNPILAGPDCITHSQNRYHTVSTLLEKNNVTRVMDLGCNRGQFIRRLARSTSFQLIVGLDIDQNLLVEVTSDHMDPEFLLCPSRIYARQNPLFAQIFRGDLLIPYQNLKAKDFDAITLIEVIQHLNLDQHQALNKTLFQFYQPKIVIMTTPNSDFNCYFDLGDKMRHYDHRFEWTQQQFIQYCQNVIRCYPYTYELFGIGQHVTEGTKNGYCSQGAVFSKRQHFTLQRLNSQIQRSTENALLIKSIRYPHWSDTYHVDIVESIVNACKNIPFDIQSDGFQSLEKIKKYYVVEMIIQRTKMSDEVIIALAKKSPKLVVNQFNHIAYNQFQEYQEDVEMSCWGEQNDCIEQNDASITNSLRMKKQQTRIGNQCMETENQEQV